MFWIIFAYYWENVDTGNCGTYSSITYSGDTLYVSYYDVDDGDLKYAWKIGDTWHYYTIDSSGDVGQFTSIYVYRGTVWISYYDNTNGDLKCASGSGTDFNVETVDATGNVGLYSSIVVENGVPHIFYYDATNGDFKHAYKSGGWTKEVIDNRGDSGLWTSAFLGSDGNIYATYYSQTYTNLHLAVIDGSVNIYTVDNGGKYSSVAVADDGTVHISYMGYYGDLLHAYGIPPNFTIDTVDNNTEAGYWTDITLDRYGQPIISYVQGTSPARLCVARFTGVWNYYPTVDTVAGSNGTSITLMGEDGYVSYFRGYPVNGLRVMVFPQLGIRKLPPESVKKTGVFDILGRKGRHGRIVFRKGKKIIILK